MRRTQITTTVFILISFAMMSCNITPETKALWINSARIDCVGVGPMQCLQVKYSPEEAWSNFYQDIEGFAYEPGYIYEVSVELIRMDPANVPADASSIRYKLVEVISKKPDELLRLNDVWALTDIADTAVTVENSKKRPYIELNTRQMTLLGSDGCNNLRGSIKQVSANTLTFGPLMSTKKACPDMVQPNAINAALNAVRQYRQEPGQLHLLDANGQVLLTFKKVD